MSLQWSTFFRYLFNFYSWKCYQQKNQNKDSYGFSKTALFLCVLSYRLNTFFWGKSMWIMDMREDYDILIHIQKLPHPHLDSHLSTSTCTSTPTSTHPHRTYCGFVLSKSLFSGIRKPQNQYFDTNTTKEAKLEN
jgi:hypothetical protein